MTFEFKVEEYGKYDVVVCGGGTAGVTAAIASARHGAKTLLIERTFEVGGMLTNGNAGITKFTEHCGDSEVYKKEVIDVLASNPKSVQIVGGIPLEFVEYMIKNDAATGTSSTAGSYVFTDRCEAQWILMDMLEKAGVEVLYDTHICDVTMNNNEVRGVLLHNKSGFMHITAKCFIDATGDADVAAFAGVEFNKGATENDVAQGCGNYLGHMERCGVMYRVRNVDFNRLFDYMEANPESFVKQEFGIMSFDNVRFSYNKGESCVFRVKTDTPEGPLYIQVYNLPEKDEAVLMCIHTCINCDGLNAQSLSDVHRQLHNGVRKTNEYLKNVPGFENIKTIHVPNIGVRETRHIIGEYTLTGMDVCMGTKFDDSIGCGGHPVDVHPIPPELENMSMNHWRFYIPFRIMLPQKIDNLLVAGRAVSATRLGFGAIRPTAQCMVMGEAAGVAAAMAAKADGTVRNIDIKSLQAKLVENGVVL